MKTFKFTPSYSDKEFDNMINKKEFKSNWIYPGVEIFYNHSSDKNQNDATISYFKDDYYITDWPWGSKKPVHNGSNFLYKLNKNGFRSNHFEKIKDDRKSILTAGCSHTFGHCLPNELRWQNILLSNVYKQEQIQHFDVSSMGASIELIVKNVISFIRNYGKPNYIFIVFPDIYRGFRFDTKSQLFKNVFANEICLTEKNMEVYKEFTLGFKEEDGCMNAITNIFALEEICFNAGIKLFWSTWSERLSKIANSVEFKNFIEYHSNFPAKWGGDEKNKNIPVNTNNLEYWNVAGDNIHFGSFWNTEVSKMFEELLKNDK